MKGRMKVGEKGQIVIPKVIRDQTGIKEGTEVVVEATGGAVTIRRAGPPTENYVDYFTTTYSKKLDHEVNIKKLLEEERVGRQKHLR
jgi:AbrB family looped-hinge helix DNA binding protein